MATAPLGADFPFGEPLCCAIDHHVRMPQGYELIHTKRPMTLRLRTRGRRNARRDCQIGDSMEPRGAGCSKQAHHARDAMSTRQHADRVWQEQPFCSHRGRTVEYCISAVGRPSCLRGVSSSTINGSVLGVMSCAARQTPELTWNPPDVPKEPSSAPCVVWGELPRYIIGDIPPGCKSLSSSQKLLWYVASHNMAVYNSARVAVDSCSRPTTLGGGGDRFCGWVTSYLFPNIG